MASPSGLITRSRSSNASGLKHAQKDLLYARMLAHLQPEDSFEYIHRNFRPVVSPTLKSPASSSSRNSGLAKRRGFEFEQVRSDFRLKPHRLIMETLKNAREIEREATPKPLQFQEFQNRFESNCRKKDTNEHSNAPSELPNQSLSFYQSTRKLELQNVDSARRFWLRRRRPNEQDQTSKAEDWIKSLYGLLDMQGSGLVSGDVLVGQLLALGLARSPEDVVQAILLIYGKKDITELNLSLEDMLELIKVDRETNKFLSFLSNRAAQEKRSGSVSPSKQRIKRSWKDQALTLSDYLTQLQAVWMHVAAGKKSLPKRQLAEILFGLKLFATILDARRALQGLKESVDYVDFQRLFSKSIMIGSLFALAIKLSPLNLAISSKMQISQYQRRLLLAGLVGGSKGVDQESGQATLKALEKYGNSVKGSPKPNSERYSVLLA